jgi:uncharacterized protein (DUF1778 family)
MSDQPKRMGRPPRAGTTADATLRFRVTSEERAAFEGHAAASGTTLSEWIRDACLLRIGREVVQRPNKVQKETKMPEHEIDLAALQLLSHEERADGLIGISVR